MTSFLDDRTSGSSSIGDRMLQELERWAAMDTSQSPTTFRAALLEQLRAAQTAQPAMAIVHRLAERALAVADTGVSRGERVPDLRAQLARSCAQERSDLVAGLAGVVKHAVQVLPRKECWVVTLSRSRLVEAALVGARKGGRSMRVLVGEGRPRFEGRDLAVALADAGIPVWLVTDAMLPLVLTQAHALWIGADAVTEHGVLNKVGSYAAALAAREASVPVYALAQRRKFIAATTPALRIPEMDGAEVWDAPPEGVIPKNVYFELVPLQLLRGVVVEDTVLPPGEATQIAREATLPAELAAATE